MQEAHKQKAVLVELLRSAWGGQALLSEVEKGADAPDLPSEGDEPREALFRLRDQLASLEERLIRQENGERRRRAWHRRADPQGTPGETIGVGAALMMVILTEWERDANLLRGRKSAGSLPFLFFDEANRLAHDNVGVLFTLCQILDPRLLIAALEVAHAEGNTTYGLVRRTTVDGREDVVASGWRTRAEA